MEELYIKTNKTVDNIQDLLYILYPLYEHNDKSLGYKEIITYHDKDCSRIQGDQKHRSYGELWILAKTMIPGLTKKLFASALIKMCQKQKVLQLMFCTNINKIVVYQGDWTYSRNTGLYDGAIFDFSTQFASGSATRRAKDGITLYDIIVKDWNQSEYEFFKIMNVIQEPYIKDKD